MQILTNNLKNHIYTISELTISIKTLLEQKFMMIWITGEVNNFSAHSSGHYYFTLKDSNSQISSVMFRGQNHNLKFAVENGMSVIGFGRITVYEPRGSYQLILEYLEPKGTGALQIAFEQLKNKLQKEGLFNEKFKTPLPYLPKKIAVITSPTGAVIYDIIRIINRRFYNIHITIIPVKVQGNGAEKEIADGIKLLNKLKDVDIAILARGGGSFDDLYAFNTEIVARAIFASKIPIISAIGHETDFTIADFVADKRAPTPSAAAEIAVQQKYEIVKRVNELSWRLKNRIHKYIEQLRLQINKLSNRLLSPQKQIQNLRLRIDDISARLNTSFMLIFEKKQSKLRELSGKLSALNPTAILNRGYSITRIMPEKTIVKDYKQALIGQMVKINLSDGILYCRVEGKSQNDSTDI